jgi:DNA-binding transcriptional ArsR family regulator
MQQEFVLETPDQVSALSHPLRVRILNLLFDEPHTNSQLAEALGESRARLHFHVQALWKEGLINLVEERPKGGVIEKYYRAAARYYRLSPSLASAAQGTESGAVVSWDTARQDLMQATERLGGPPPELKSGRFRYRMRPEAFAEVQQHLQAIEEIFRDAIANPVTDETALRASFAYIVYRTPAEE